MWKSRAGWYIESGMNAIRKASWFPLLSLLLLAALVPVQAAGCCKLGMLLSAESPAESPAKAVSANDSCCPKSADDASPASGAPDASPGDCAGGKGCCLEGVAAVDAALISTPASSLPVFAVAFVAMPHETVTVVTARPALALPADSGPPLYLAHLRLLI